jgi:hypothetical protein
MFPITEAQVFCTSPLVRQRFATCLIHEPQPVGELHDSTLITTSRPVAA